MRPVLTWLAVVALVAWGLSVLTGHLPPRLRLLVLFSVAFGLLVGGAAGLLADEFGVRRVRRSSAALFLLTVAGLVNQTLTAYRQEQAAGRARAQADPQQMLALQFLQSAMADDPELKQRYLEERARLQPTFGDYLAQRWSRWGRMPAPWPAIIWGAELMLGGIAAVLMFRRPRALDPSHVGLVEHRKPDA
jgi:hypothetical protein